MARPSPPWLAEPVMSTSGSGSLGMSRGRLCGLGARPWFPNPHASGQSRFQTIGIENRTMFGMPHVHMPETWVRSLSLPPSAHTDESGWSTPMESPRPVVPALALPPQAIPVVQHMRHSISLSPRASSSSSSCIGHGRRSIPEGPTIPSQRKAASGFPLNALSCMTDAAERKAAFLHAKTQLPLSAGGPAADPMEPTKPCTTSHVLLERNQVPQKIQCKQETQAFSQNQSSDYLVYSSRPAVSTNNAQPAGASDGSPTNTVWKRYFAATTGDHGTYRGYVSDRSPVLEGVHCQSDLNSLPSLPATAPNSERGKQEGVNFHCPAPFQVHERVRPRCSESQDSHRGLRDVVGLFGIPVADAKDISKRLHVVGSCGQASNANGSQVSTESETFERPLSDSTETSQKSAPNVGANRQLPQVYEGGEPSGFSHSGGSGSFVPDPAQVEAIAQSAAKVEAAAQKISLKHLHELRSFRQPPAAICQVVEAALSLFGINANWSCGRRRLDSQFLNKLKAFTPLEAAKFPSAHVHRFLEHLDAPAFSERSLLDKCPGAAPLAQWCFAAAALLLHLQVSDASGKLSRFELSGTAESETKVEVKTMRAPQREMRDIQKHLDLGGLFVKPSLWELSSDELQCVEDLVIGREGVGQVTFHGKTDCCGLLENLSQILSIQPGEIIVYPDAALKPDVGYGLNKPASVELRGCMPKCQVRLTDSRAQQRYKQRVMEMTQEKGAIFEDYDPIDGTWKFRVPHF